MFIICVPFIFTSISTFACTIFMQSGEDTVLVGNNEDFYYSYTSMYWIARGDNEYSRICFGISSYVQGGMNEKGLFYDGATCPYSQTPYDENKETLGMDAGDIILSKCASVKEAVEFLYKYNITSDYGDHLLFADSSGDAAVVEWLEDEMRVIWVENDKLIATNFFLTNPALGGYPCDRYETVESALNELSSPTVADFSTILSTTSQDFGDGGTKYSNIYDLKALTVYVYEKADFSNVAVISLSDELNKPDAGDGSYVNINTLNYRPASLIFDGENMDDRQVEETALADGDSSDNVNPDIIKPDIAEEEGSVVPFLLLIFGFTIIALFVFYFLNRRKR